MPGFLHCGAQKRCLHCFAGRAGTEGFRGSSQRGAPFHHSLHGGEPCFLRGKPQGRRGCAWPAAPRKPQRAWGFPSSLSSRCRASRHGMECCGAPRFPYQPCRVPGEEEGSQYSVTVTAPLPPENTVWEQPTGCPAGNEGQGHQFHRSPSCLEVRVADAGWLRRGPCRQWGQAALGKRLV